MVEISSLLLVFTWAIPVVAQYESCPEDLSWSGDGYCDAGLNNLECGYDGGDCCKCTCANGPMYACGYAGFSCVDPECLDPDVQATFFPDCSDSLVQVNDGACDADNNNAACGYDGGDCCICTCVAEGECSFGSFDCLDPSAEEHLFQCQPLRPSTISCSPDVQRTWVVEDSAQVQAMAEAVNCSGGAFEVAWIGNITVDKTIYVSHGTVLNISGIGPPSSAVINGGIQTRLLTVINASLYISDVDLSSGSSVVGGAIAASSSNVTLTRTSFSGNRASGMGGAIYAVSDSSVLFYGNETTFLNNSAGGYGGALYVSGSSIIRFNGQETYVLHNTAENDGGAIAIEQSELSWHGNAFFANNTSGAFGGAMNVANGSTAAWIGNLVFSENTAAFSGGALAVASTSAVSWSGNATLSYNQAAVHGGAMYINGAEASWDGNAEFKRNTAGSTGGALFASSAAGVSWGGVSTFFNNSAYSLGGAINVVSGSFFRWNGPNTTFAFNRVLSGSGGAINIYVSSVSSGGDTTFEYNDASFLGGAVSIQEADVSWEGTTRFASNTAPEAGGALFALSASGVLWKGVTSFFNNSAVRGGAVYAMEGTNMRWTGPTTIFVSNTAVSEIGGAIVVADSTLSWSGSTEFVHNRANDSGGAIFIQNSNVTWDGHTAITSKEAAGSEGTTGTNVAASWGDVSFSGETLFFNNSAMTGGAMYASRGSNVSWSGPTTTFTSNTASFSAGGAIAVIGTNLSCSGATIFVDNSAKVFGGGIVMWPGTRSDWSGNVTFSKNNATFGGAVYIYEDVSATRRGYTAFMSNKAEEGGGAMAVNVLDATADDERLSILSIAGTAVLADNVCNRDGGAMWLAGGLSMEIDSTANVTFQRNRAVAAGGAIFITGAYAGPTFPGVSFVSNSAQLGGGVYATSSGNAKITAEGSRISQPITFDRCRFVGNTATATGGAIQSAAGQDKMISTSFEGNSARAGGALYLAGTSEFFGCSFIDNESDEGAGLAIFNIGYVATMQNSSFGVHGYNCAPGTFLIYIESDNLFEALCVDCYVACEGCRFEEPSRVSFCEGVMLYSTSAGGSTTIEQLNIEPGYWRATGSSKVNLACYYPNACKGGVTAEASAYCKEGYEGPYCSVCNDGYTEGLGFECDRCSSTSAGVVLAVVVFLAAAVAVVMLVRYLMSGDALRTRRGFVGKLVRFIPFQSIKIILVAWQILTQFAAVANVTFPNIYQRFLNGIMVLNFDLSWILSVGCIFDLDFHDRLLFATLGPIVAVTTLGVTYSVAVLRNRGSGAVLAIIRHKHVSALLLLAFLVHSSVSTILFQTFACDRLDDGENYLRADYRIHCDSQKHVAFTIYSSFMTTLYAIGIPVLFAGLLFKDRRLLAATAHRSNSRNNDARADNPHLLPTSQLWGPYRPKRFYYEVIECGRRILLTGVVVFIYPNTAAQIAITLAIAFTFAMVSEGLNPYASTWDTWVSRMGHVVVVATVYVALLLKVDTSQEQRESQKVFEVVLVLVHACMVMAVLGEALVLVLSLKVERREDPSPRFRRMKWIHGNRDVPTK